MKIKLSKSQWELIGKKTGWIKEANQETVTIDRYPNSRFWGVYYKGELLCVTVYLKGARAVKELVEKLSAKVPPEESVVPEKAYVDPIPVSNLEKGVI